MQWNLALLGLAVLSGTASASISNGAVAGAVRDSPDDDGAQIAERAGDSAWKTAGASSDVRLHTSHLRAAVAAKRAIKAYDVTEKNLAAPLTIVPQVNAAEAQAQASLTEALSWQKKAETLINGVQARAYFSAKNVAQAESDKYFAEAATYYNQLVATENAKADDDGDARSQAAAKAAEPYVKVQLRAAAMVEAYNKQATDTLNLARNIVGQAVSIAYTAQREQAYGNGVMAQRHMMQAHQLIGAAKVKKELAMRIRQLVESINTSIPSYQQAAQNAATHALAVFVGLQASKDDEYAASLATLDAALEKAEHMLSHSSLLS